MILKKIIDYRNTFENPKKGAWIVFGIWCVVFTILSQLDGKSFLIEMYDPTIGPYGENVIIDIYDVNRTPLQSFFQVFNGIFIIVSIFVFWKLYRGCSAAESCPKCPKIYSYEVISAKLIKTKSDGIYYLHKKKCKFCKFIISFKHPENLMKKG